MSLTTSGLRVDIEAQAIPTLSSMQDHMPPVGLSHVVSLLKVTVRTALMRRREQMHALSFY